MKASILFGAGWENDSVDVRWRDAERAFCRLWRNHDEGEKHAFIPIPGAVDHLTLESVNRLMHEHELKSYLDNAWALRPLELVRERGQTMLVVDYTGGEALDRLMREPMEIGLFLRLSVALSGAVGQLSQTRLLQKARQRRAPCGLGATETPIGRYPRRLPISAVTSRDVGSLVLTKLLAKCS